MLIAPETLIIQAFSGVDKTCFIIQILYFMNLKIKAKWLLPWCPYGILDPLRDGVTKGKAGGCNQMTNQEV